uniref:Uncharacterized protein n=1 Tax=Anguilla anguilla TaxID=7936 RepID=A0A0E9UX75_ANGAN
MLLWSVIGVGSTVLFTLLNAAAL